MKKQQTNQQIANSIARKSGYGTATKIEFGNIPSGCVVSHVSYGYRKCSTGEYVPTAYLNNFGWKNTYYQSAETVVMLPQLPKVG